MSKEVQELSKRGRGMVSEPRFLISAFLEDVLNEIATFDGPKASKAGSRETQSAPRKQYNSILRPARKTCGSESVAIGTAAAQGRRKGGGILDGEQRGHPRKIAIFSQNLANRSRGKQFTKR